MRLPARLLEQIRVGVGVGAVLLCGCDVVDQTLAEVAPADAAVSIAPVPLPEAPKAAPTPAQASSGLADKVVEALGRAEPRGREPEPPVVAERAPEPEDITAFVPFGAGSSATPTRPSRPKTKIRPRIAVAAPVEVVDEPCEAAVSASVRPERDPCPACGRG